MLRVGLTGGIGSGKTTISDYFKSLYKIPIIDADEISRELVSPQGEAYNEVIKLFGNDVILEQGHINRKLIREKIFESPKLRDSLELIIHPKVKKNIFTQTKELASNYCLIVIPLLFESNMQSTVDRILVIDTKKKFQISRVSLRDQCSEDHAETIIEAQLSTEEKLKYADDIITNDGTRESLIPQIEQLHQKYLALSR